MSKYAYIAYNKRSATTGKALFDSFKATGLGGFTWRHCSDADPAKTPELVIRWGNSYLDIPAGVLEINTKAACENASDKLKMAKLLSKCKDVTFPQLVLAEETIRPLNGITTLANGPWFIRNSDDQIRYRNTFQTGDKYAVKEIDKVREFRVHVFDGEVLGIMEKIPNEPGAKILKAENSNFKRIDQRQKEQTSTLKGVRPMAKAAVAALGLVYGGVDVIMDRNGNVYVLEVNSSPALNEPNIGRWTKAFGDYITNKLGKATAPKAKIVAEEQIRINPAEERRQQEEAALQRGREARLAEWQALEDRFHGLAQEHGFRISVERENDNLQIL